MGTLNRIADWDRRTTERVARRHRWLSWIEWDQASDRWIWKRRTTARLAGWWKWASLPVFLIVTNGNLSRGAVVAALVLTLLAADLFAWQLERRAGAYERHVVLPEDKRLERDAR